MRLIQAIWRDRRGATAVEYGFIIALVTIIVAVGIGNVATTTINMWNMIAVKVAKS